MPANNPPIDPRLDPAYRAERTLAVVGVRAVVSRAVEKITADQRRQINAYDKLIAQHAKALVADEIKCAWPAPPAYKALLRDLTQPLDQHQVEEMISKLAPEVQTAFLPIAGNAFLFLQNALPRSISKSLAGFKQLPIDDPSWFRFVGLLRVLDDPLQVFELAVGGGLMRNEVAAVRELFPTVSKAIDEALTAAIIDAKAKDLDYELPAMAEDSVSIWFGLPTITVPTASVYQQANKTRDQQQRPSTAQLSPEAASSVTAADGALYPRAAG